MYSIRSVTNLFALNNVSAGSLILFGRDGKVLQVPGQNPDNPLFIIDATTGTVTVNGTFSNPSAAPTPVSLGDGTLSAPSMAFASNSNTGIYRPDVNQLGLVAGGTRPVIVGVDDITFSDKRLLNVGTLITAGTAGSLSIADSSAPTSSLKVSNQLITGVVNAVNKLYIRDADIETTIPIRAIDGTAAEPAYSFKNDVAMGMWRSSNFLNLSTGGVSRLAITDDATNVLNALSTEIKIPVVETASLAILTNGGDTVAQGTVLYVTSGPNIQVVSVASPTIQLLGTFVASGTRSIFVYGRYFYAADPDINVYDVQNPASVVQVGTVAVPSGLTSSMYAQGNRLYAVSYLAELYVYDITKTVPVLLGSAVAPPNTRNVLVKDGVVFVLGETSIRSYDVSMPITQLDSKALGGTGAAVISGNHIYCVDTTDEANSNINIINISNPAGMFVEGFLPLRNIDLVDVDLSSIVVSGRYAYVGVKSNPVIYIINVANPITPVYYGKIITIAPTTSLVMEGNYLYATTSDTLYKFFLGGTTIDNLSVGSVLVDALHVKTQSLLDSNLTVLGGAYMNALEVRGSLGVAGVRYPTQDGTAGQALLTDGAGNLTFQNIAASTAALSDGTSLAPSMAFILDPDTGVFRASNNVMGISTGATISDIPVLISDIGFDMGRRLVVGVGGIDGVLGQDIKIRSDGGNSDMLFKAGVNQPITFNFGGLPIVSITQVQMSVPAVATLMGTVTTPSYTFAGDADTGLYSFEPNALNITAGGVDVAQVKPVDFRIYKSLYAFASAPSTFLATASLVTAPQLIELQGDKAYILLNSVTFQVVDISTPQAPVLIGAPVTAAAVVLSMFIYGRYLYAGIDGGFIIFDVLDPTNIIQKSITALGFPVPGIYSAGNRVFAVTTNGILYIYDSSNVGSPFQLSAITLSSPAINVISQSKYVFAISHTQIMAYDIGLPTAPVLINTLAVTGAGFVKIYGMYIFIVDSRVGPPNNMTIVNIADPNSMIVHSVTNLMEQVGDFGVGGKIMLITSQANPYILILDITDRVNPTVLDPIQLVAPAKGLGTSGKYLSVICSNNTFYTYDIGGSRIDSTEIGVAKISKLTVDESLFVQNNLSVEGGLYISGGVNIEGGVGLNGFTFPIVDGVAGQALVTNGAGRLSFASAATNPIGINSGTSINPGVYFNADPDTGLFLAGVNTMGISSGSTFQDTPVLIDPSSFFIASRELKGVGLITGSTSVVDLMIRDGSQASSIVLKKGNEVGFFSGIQFNTAVGKVAEAGTTDWQFDVTVKAPSGSESVPSFTFKNDPNSGMWNSTDGVIDFTTNGLTKLQVGPTNIVAKSSISACMEIPVTFFGQVSLSSTPSLIAAQGSSIYTYTGGGIQMVSTNDPGMLTASDVFGAGISVRSIFAYGSFLFVGSDVVSIFDVSNQANFTLVGVLSGVDNFVQGLFVSGNLIYTVGLGAQFNISEYADPANPKILWDVSVPGSIRDLFVQNDRAFMTGELHVYIYKVSANAPPTLISTILNMELTKIVVSGNYLYGVHTVDSPFRFFRIIDVSQEVAVPIGSYSYTGKNVSNLIVSGNQVLVSNQTNDTIDIISIVNKAAPVLLATIATVNTPTDLVWIGRFLFISSGDSIYSYDVGGSFIESLEAGAAKLNFLQVDESANINNNLVVMGGITATSAHFTRGVNLNKNVWPVNDGAPGQFLRTDGAGNLSFYTPTISGVSLSDGLDAAPSLFFTNEVQLGVFRSAPGVLGFSTGVMSAMTVSDGDVNFNYRALRNVSVMYGNSTPMVIASDETPTSMRMEYGAGSVIRFFNNNGYKFDIGTTSIEAYQAMLVPEGLVNAPAYAFSIAPSRGMYLDGGVIAFASEGSNLLKLNPTATVTPYAYKVSLLGSAVSPSYTFETQSDLGMYALEPNRLSFTSGGVERMAIEPSRLHMLVQAQSLVGSAAVPSYSFSTTANAGMYLNGSNLAFSTFAVKRLEISNVDIVSALQMRSIDGSVGLPGYGFTTDVNSGMFLNGTGNVGFVTGGVSRMNLSGSALTMSTVVLARDGTATSPSYAFAAQANTGMFQPVVNEFDISISGVSRFHMTASSATFTGTLLFPSGSATVPGAGFSAGPTNGISLASGLNLIVASDNIVNVSGARVTSKVTFASPNGTELAPSYGFISQPSTGMYFVTFGKIGLSIGGNLKYEFDLGSFNIISPGSVGATSLRWRSNAGLGLYSASETSIGVAVGGVELFSVDSTKGISMNIGANHPTVSVSEGTTTLTNAFYLIRLTATNNQFITLPLASTMPGRQIILFKKVIGGSVTIYPTSPDTIDGTLTSIVFSALYDRIVFVSDGENTWITI